MEVEQTQFITTIIGPNVCFPKKILLDIFGVFVLILLL